jgi:hypothetical protein
MDVRDLMILQIQRDHNFSNSETNMKQCRLTQFLQFLCRKGSGRSSPELYCGGMQEGEQG